jgi:diacylglycerol kinase (ATP)
MEDGIPRLDELKRYLFVINPIAGEVEKGAFQKRIREESRTYDWDFKEYLTTGKNDREIIQEILKSYDPDLVIAVGGDGTVNLVAELLAGSKRALAIIPAGSGNGLAKDLHIPQNNLPDALEQLLHGQIVEIDTLRANKNFFMHLADIGFNAHIVKLFSKSSSRGLFTYMRFVLKEFFKYPTNYYEIETDNGSFKGNAFMITIANSNQFGSNLTINPDGNWSDGKFEVVIIKRFPKKQALALFFRLLTKKIQFSPHCIIIQCTKAKIICEKKKTLQYDGEIAGKVRKANFSIKKRNLRIVIP